MKSKVLIIDDDSSVLDILNVWLSEEGFEVLGVTGTNDIIELVNVVEPDVVLLDYLLQGYTGGDLCRQIKACSKYRNLPVVIFSALNENTITQEQLNCDAYIAKPFDLYQLTAQLNELISQVTSGECADEWA